LRSSECSDPEAEGVRRRQLVHEWQAATGISTKTAIYKAPEVRVHRPDFYKWLNGELARQSAGAIRIEAFLQRRQPSTARGSER
jgi:hypothetical protein